MKFKDHFSNQSTTYRAFRPTYPDALFAYLRTLTKDNDLAWDCGTGNGQAAIGLTRHYKKVIATDPSEQQIANAIQHDQISYRVEKAEQSSLEAHSVDLITVAQALHWFEFDAFYAEVKWVLKPGGVIAAWAYGLPTLPDEVKAVIRHFHDVVVGEFWQAENNLISKKYTTIPFPFLEIEAPPFFISKMVSLDEVLGHVSSWSATQKFIAAKSYNPVEGLKNDLLQVWGNEEEKEATWKLMTKIDSNM